jgi:hypothetical protein
VWIKRALQPNPEVSLAARSGRGDFLLTGTGYIFALLEQIVTVSSSENEKPHDWERPTIALL